jgi:hypothetical protein
LSYNAPQSYACAELLAIGLSHVSYKCENARIYDIKANLQALDTYPGGRAAGLSDLGKGLFNSSRMTPSFYNLKYTGPAGSTDRNRTLLNTSTLKITLCIQAIWGFLTLVTSSLYSQCEKA